MGLPLKLLRFGEPDAKIELTKQRGSDGPSFSQLFYSDENFDFESYYRGSRFIIYGLKGTGKTALLRHLKDKANSEGAITDLILFKSDIRENEREQLSKATGFSVVESGKGQFGVLQDYKAVWRIFLHRQLAKFILMENSPIAVDEEACEYAALIDDSVQESKPSWYKRISENIENGKIRITASMKILSVIFSAKFKERKSKGDHLVPAGDLADLLDNKLFSLNSSNGKIQVYIDELELSFDTAEQYQRDSRMIADLIDTAIHMNMMFIEKNYNIRFYIGVRSEVLWTVYSAAREIERDVSSFGREVSWHRRGNRAAQPLLAMVQKRIEASESFENSQRLGYIWEDYFPNYPSPTALRKHLLDLTWYKPRDLVRILGICQERAPTSTSIDQEVLFEALNSYSSAAWSEISAELSAVYTEKEIAYLKSLFSGFKKRFKFDEIDERPLSLERMYPGIASFVKKRTTSTILKDLFRLGVIGNNYKDSHAGRNSVRWIFRGDKDIYLDKDIVIHNGLLKEFNLSQKSEKT